MCVQGLGLSTALVTGGNRGIGLEVVKILLGRGQHFVFLGCRNLAAGEALVETLAVTFGPRVLAVCLDVEDADSVSKAASTVAQHSDHLDVLVNNAGVLLDSDGAPFAIESCQRMLSVNFEGVVAVTEAFLPMLRLAPKGGHVLSTSSGTGARTLGLLGRGIQDSLADPSLDVFALRQLLDELINALRNVDSEYREIPTVGYGISKMAVNCFTQILARQEPGLRANACSPGFCNTDMCANYTGERKPKDPALGASVFAKVLFEGLGEGRSGLFFKENSKANTPLDSATSVVDPWVV